MSTAIKVAVRMRPFNSNELAASAKPCVTLLPSSKQCTIRNPQDNSTKTFTYDFLYDSFVDPGDPSYASQDTVWGDIGSELLEAAWAGYNYSLFAYGQTGSGKSHSMVGFGEDRGIIPRACEAIFEKIAANREANQSEGGEAAETTYKVECSMLEIYNERVRDLFVPMSQQDRGGLKVRALNGSWREPSYNSHPLPPPRFGTRPRRERTCERSEASTTEIPVCGGSGSQEWSSGGDPPNPPCGRRGWSAEVLVGSVASESCRPRGAQKAGRCRAEALGRAEPKKRVVVAALPERKRSAVRSPKNESPPSPSCSPKRLAARGPKSERHPRARSRHPRARSSARPRGARKTKRRLP
jgi:hypothetical protein